MVLESVKTMSPATMMYVAESHFHMMQQPADSSSAVATAREDCALAFEFSVFSPGAVYRKALLTRRVPSPDPLLLVR